MLFGLVLLGLLLSAAPVSAGSGAIPGVTVSATIGQCGLEGKAENIGAFRLKHRSASGALKATYGVNASGGTWGTMCSSPRIAGGDKLLFFELGHSTPFQTLTIPKLVLKTDRVHDKVRGTAPGVTTVSLSLTSCDVAFHGCTGRPSAHVPVNPITHRFTYSAGENVTGGWEATLVWTKGPLLVRFSQRTAQLVVQPGSATVGRTGQTAGQSVAVSVRRGQNVGLANPTTKSDASFSALVKRGGAPMKVRTDDVVSSSIAGDAVLTVPETWIELDGANIEGHCFKNRPVTVFVRDAAGGFQDAYMDSTDLNGSWSHAQVLQAGWTVDAYCGNAKGDALKLHLVAL
jgi:hypothetical protein